jgi:hypothetical protein
MTLNPMNESINRKLIVSNWWLLKLVTAQRYNRDEKFSSMRILLGLMYLNSLK